MTEHTVRANAYELEQGRGRRIATTAIAVAGLVICAVAGIALLGWVGVPGATAAQVVLLDQVFGDLATTVGLGAGAWVIVLLWASKADTYGPFPNANMVGAMGLARSTNLRSLLLTGWLVLIPASLMYVAILAVLG